MGSTCHAVNIHYIFSTRDREPLITHDLEPRVWSFIGGILRNNKMRALAIGGTADHIHMLAVLPTTMSVSKGIQLVKGGSSKWINDTFVHLRGFRWQEGYAAFSVGVSQVPKTIAYIGTQEEHHGRKSFKEEFLAFLEKHRIDYDERYIWR